MSSELQYTIIDGIKCYSAAEAGQYTDYPDDGFDLTERLEAESFWVRSRNRLLRGIVSGYARGVRRLLEIGCGNGALIRELTKIGNIEITGSEIYLKGLVYARTKLPQVEFVQFDVTKGMLPGRFDMILACDVIEHIDDDRAAIRNVYDMLEPGGHFVVTVPQYQFLWSRLDEIVCHKRRYSRRELLSKLRGEGFDIRFSTSFVFMLFPLMALARLLDRPGKPGQPAPVGDKDFERRVGLPRIANVIFDKIMRIDEWLISKGISLPFGGTLLAVAQKRKERP